MKLFLSARSYRLFLSPQPVSTLQFFTPGFLMRIDKGRVRCLCLISTHCSSVDLNPGTPNLHKIKEDKNYYGCLLGSDYVHRSVCPGSLSSPQCTGHYIGSGRHRFQGSPNLLRTVRNVEFLCLRILKSSSEQTIALRVLSLIF